MKVDYSNVAGTLKLGIKFPKWFYIVLLPTLGVTAITFLIVLIIQQFYNIGLDTDDQLFFLIFGIMFLIGFILVLCLLFKEYHIWKKKINEYLNDENLICLQVIPYKFSTVGLAFYAQIKIGIKFRYNNKLIHVQSDKYNKRFFTYVDKLVNIAYSPKYDQIIIFKN